MLGMQLRSKVPDHHLADDSRHLLEVSLGIIGTMSGLVLGLLVASSTATYNTQRSEVFEVSSKIILLDRLLAHYGPEASGARRVLKETAVLALYRVWPKDAAQQSILEPVATGSDVFFDDVERLPVKTENQRMIKGEAMGLLTSLVQTRWLMYEQVESGISLPLLVMLVFWFSITFLGFGMFAPRNATVMTALAMCAMAVSGAVFLMLEMNTPFSGIVQISSAPLLDAIKHLGQ